MTLARIGGDLQASLFVDYTLGGTAANSSDYVFTGGSVTIPAGSAAATVTITPRADNAVEGDETVVLTIEPTTGYTIDPGAVEATVTIADDPVVVTVVATDPDASEAGLDPGELLFSRAGGNLASSLSVLAVRGGTATNGLDYDGIGGSTVLVIVPAGLTAATLAIVPKDDSWVEGPETVVLTLQASSSYLVGTPGQATVTIADDD